jgi:hypothetical protein
MSDSRKHHTISIAFTHRQEGRKRQPAQETVFDSYANQHYRLELDGRLFQLAPVDQETQLPETEERPVAPGFIISAWNPNGDPAFENDNNDANEQLERDLAHFTYTPLVTLARNSRWIERSFLVQGINRDKAIELARKYGQKGLVALTDNTLEVILVDEPTPANSQTLKVIELPVAPCPLMLEFEAENECRPYGGPYGSAAIEAAAVWSFQSKLLIGALGCSVCQKPSQPYRQRSGAIAIRPAAVPSRFGGWQWMPRKEA